MDDYFQAELSALRSELNANITSMIANETFCATACVALISFAGTKQAKPTIFALTFFLAAVIYAFGLARYKVMERHTALLDKYMIENDKQKCGWATWYAENEPETFPRYKATRTGFWVGLALVLVFSAVLIHKVGF